jgi:2-oxoglutarate dehydrogenase E2 component (dihydrolipoamide succinyltransferase)
MITFKILREQNGPPAPAPKQKQTAPAPKQAAPQQAPTQEAPKQEPTQEAPAQQPSEEQAAADFVVKTANDAIAKQFDELEKKLVAAVQNAVGGGKQPAAPAQKTAAPAPAQKPTAPPQKA